MPSTAAVERMLRGAGLRVTGPRRAVLAAVYDRPHVNTDGVISVVRERLDAVSHQAVYDVLRALTAAGLVRRIEPAGSAARYEARVGDNHHHAVCRSCGAIADVECAVGSAPCLTGSDDAGYAIDEAEVIYWGRCAQCTATRPGAERVHAERKPARQHTPVSQQATSTTTSRLRPGAATREEGPT